MVLAFTGSSTTARALTFQLSTTLDYDYDSPVCALLLHLFLLHFDRLHLLSQLCFEIFDLVATNLGLLAAFVVLVLQLLFQPEN